MDIAIERCMDILKEVAVRVAGPVERVPEEEQIRWHDVIYGDYPYLEYVYPGAFYMKDSSGPVRRHNDVPYTRDQMEAWLVGAFENRYAICKAVS